MAGPGDPPRGGRPWLHQLDAEDRARLVAAQVKATRPAFTAVLLAGAAMLAVAAALQALGTAQGIGYPAWLVSLMSAAVAMLAWVNLRVRSWHARLAALLAAMLLVGVFLSVPLPGAMPVDGVPLRTSLFQMMAMALQAHGLPFMGRGFYWLHVAATVGFGFMLSGYRSDFAIEAYQVRRSLWKQAATDALTGLANRAGWDRDAVPVYADAGARGAARSLVFFDVDHFKDVNDRLGHAQGDDVLRRLGQVLAARTGPDGYAARMGGAEFTAHLGDAPPGGLPRVALRGRVVFPGIAGHRAITLSAGIAFAAPDEPLEDAMRRADAALYAAKQAGRDRIKIADDDPATGPGAHDGFA